jgi:putative redox protein
MEVTVEHLGAVQFEIKARKHTIVSDQPHENFGFDEGMTPPEIFLASIGACAAYYAAEFLGQKNLAREGTRIKVSADKVMNPPRLDRIRIDVELPRCLDQSQREGVDRAVHRCLIHNTLVNPPHIEIAVHQPAAALS